MDEELRTASYKVGLAINLSKTKVMFNRNVAIQPIMTGNVALDQVDRYTYLGQLISIHRDWEPEVRQRVALGWQAFGRLNNVWRSKLSLCLKRKVSWVRQSDYHILTVGKFTYAADERFSAFHRPDTDDWLLEIKYPKTSDSGTYECQVSTEPMKSLEVYLKVIVARAMIRGSPDLFVKRGSSMNLQCIVSPPSALQDYVFWYHNQKVINYDNMGGSSRVKVDTPSDFSTVSTLTISDIDVKDSGNYTCKPSTAIKASIRLHVLDANGNILFYYIALLL
ncbi:Zwei Ig domain protein zig-8 [Nymphon striatum]|nr:Zwei Ig domain protein zig-8 [Nymphon striatum]